MPSQKDIRHRKICLLGFRSVGKSSLVVQYVKREFPEQYDPTIEQMFTTTCTIRGQEYFLHILDTSGQDEFSIFPPQYAIDFHGYCMVYSIDSRKSFEVIQVIYEKLLDAAGGIKKPIVLVGNKTDLSEQRMITPEEGQELANKWGCPFVELTAKHSKRVNDLFSNLTITIDGGDPNEKVGPPTGSSKESKCSMM